MPFRIILDPGRPDALYPGTSGYGVFKSCYGGATRAAAPTVNAGSGGGLFKIRLPIGKEY
jgi:hypothetical protein